MLNREIYVYTIINIIFVLFGKKRDSLPNGVEKIDKNFKHVKKNVNENNFKQRIRYRFPKHEKIDQLENVLVFDLETNNDQEVAEAYAAGLYKMNRFRVMWDRDLTVQEIETKENVTVFDGPNGNPVVNMLKHNSENYEGDERKYIDRDGDEIVSFYRLLLVGHSSSGFDSWFVLNFSVKEKTELKVIKTPRD